MKQPIKVLIIKESTLALEKMKTALQDMQYVVSGFASNTKEALLLLNSTTSDIVIMDLNTPGEISGNKLAETIKEQFEIPIIFHGYAETDNALSNTTINEHGILSANYNKSEICASIESTLRKFTKIDRKIAKNVKVNAVHKQLTLTDFIFIKDKTCYCKIQVSDILYIMSEEKYTKIVLSNKRYMIRQSISDFISLLPAESFKQVHRSYAVNLNAVNKIGSNFLVIGETEIPMSNSRKDSVMSSFHLI